MRPLSPPKRNHNAALTRVFPDFLKQGFFGFDRRLKKIPCAGDCHRRPALQRLAQKTPGLLLKPLSLKVKLRLANRRRKITVAVMFKVFPAPWLPPGRGPFGLHMAARRAGSTSTVPAEMKSSKLFASYLIERPMRIYRGPRPRVRQ